MNIRRPLRALVGLALLAAVTSVCYASKMEVSSADGVPVTIYRDKWGVPHVYADTAPAAFYGGAYSIAHDRLAQGELYMRMQLGRMAEIMGPGSVKSDQQARLYLPSTAEIKAQFYAIPPKYQAILAAMHAGWNAYVDKVRKNPQKLLPYQFQQWGIMPTRWTLWEYLKVMGGLQRGYGSGGGGHELTNLAFFHYLKKKFGEPVAKQIFNDVLPLNDPDAVPIIPAQYEKGHSVWGRQTNGSPAVGVVEAAAVSKEQASLPMNATLLAQVRARRNAFARTEQMAGLSEGASRVFMIGKRRSATGNPFMLHSTADGPDVHIHGGGFDVAGFVLPPFCPIIMGRTLSNGFTFTTGERDLVDIYAERINPDNPLQYWYKGEWRNMEVHNATIHVKGGDPVQTKLEYTVHGPVIARDKTKHVAYSRKNAIRGHELQGLVAMLELNRAHDMASYKQAAADMVFNFNVNYAGVDGHIALYHSGLLPLRPASVDPRLPAPGTGQYEWLGFVPDEDHPFVVDPKQGYIHAWNNKITKGNRYGDTSRYGKSYRTWLGRKLATSSKSITLNDMKRFNRLMGLSAGAVDLSVTNPAYFVPYLRAAVKGARDPKLAQAVEAIAKWNGIFQDQNDDRYYDSVGLTVYRAWYPKAQKQIIGDDIGDWWYRIDASKYIKYRTDVLLRAIEGSDAGNPMEYDWFDGKPRDIVLRQTLKSAIAKLTKKYGTANIKSWHHPIFWKYYDASAVAENPNKMPYPGAYPGRPVRGSTAGLLGLQPPYVPQNLMGGWTMLLELTPRDIGLYDITPTGGQNQFIDIEGSGNPHIADQVMLDANFKFKRVPLKLDVIKRTAESTHRISMPKDALQP